MDCPNELVMNNDKSCHFVLSSYWSSNKQYKTVGIFALGQLVIFFPVIINEPSTFRRKTLVATIRRSRDFDIYDRSHFLISYHDRRRFVDDRRRFVDSRMYRRSSTFRRRLIATNFIFDQASTIRRRFVYGHRKKYR